MQDILSFTDTILFLSGGGRSFTHASYLLVRIVTLSFASSASLGASFGLQRGLEVRSICQLSLPLLLSLLAAQLMCKILQLSTSHFQANAQTLASVLPTPFTVLSTGWV